MTTSRQTFRSARTSRPLIDVLALRVWHSYVGLFVAPMVIFFSLSGCLQIFDLHEAHPGYTPTAFLSSVGRLHKDQIFAPVPTDKAGAHVAAEPSGRKAPAEVPKAPALKTTALKWFFFVEALAVSITTLFGVIIGLKHAKRAKACAIILAAGIAVPIMLIVL